MMTFTITMCEDCFDLDPGQCNNSECIFCRKTSDEVAPILDALLIRPIVNNEQLIADA